jgi:hypothetical protein
MIFLFLTRYFPLRLLAGIDGPFGDKKSACVEAQVASSPLLIKYFISLYPSRAAAVESDIAISDNFCATTFKIDILTTLLKDE